MISLLFVGLGGALGAVGRFALNIWASSRWEGFPAGTFLVNITGSFLLGLLIGYDLTGGCFFSGDFFLLLTAGFMGSFTTFSTFSVEVIVLIREKGLLKGLHYPFLTLVLGIAGAVLGLCVGVNCPG